ncbi:FxSxx-COOH system tetratricopeptide repeat protein [Nocardia asteroides]|uniref:FxSxx-COOH system tetratricopeptide repeat protein n=1 Tax=Nocardia asteroides TaxID=1824 RepID=UPI0033C9BD08
MSRASKPPGRAPEAARALGELIGDKLRESVISSQTELARKAHSSKSTVSALINADRPATWATVRPIAQVLEDSEQWITRVRQQWELADRGWHDLRRPAGTRVAAANGPSPGMVVVGRIPRQAPHFIDRAQSEQLRAALTRRRVAAVVCGMRGAGKTQVAAAYAREVIAAGGPGLVGWVSAENRFSTVTDMAEIANRLGVADPDGDSLRSAHRLRDLLTGDQAAGLLVFDNATDPDFLDELLPEGPSTQVVITSTDRAFTGFGETVDIGEGFARPESALYLEAVTERGDPFGASRVAAEVGDLPLALAAAAATITSRRLDYRRYLELLAAQPILDALAPQRGSIYKRSVYQALSLAIDTVTATTGDRGVDERVRWLVGVMAMLSPDGVETALLQDTDHRVGAAIGRCVEGSLLTWSVDGRALVMHRLLRRVVCERAQITGSLGAVVDTATAVLASSLFDEIEAFQRRDEGARLVDHIQAIIDTTAHHLDLSTGTHAAVLATRRWAIRQLTKAADLNRAITFAERTLSDHEHHLSIDHPDTLSTRHDLAHAYREAGRVGEAIATFEQLLPDRQRVSGPDHPDTLSTRHDLAHAYRKVGRISEAITMFEQLLPDRRRVLGPDHPNSLSTRSNLAYAALLAGRVGEAITMFEQLLPDRQRVLGPDHPSALSTRGNLACAYLSAGRGDAAIVMFEELLPDRQRVLGPDHPFTLITRGDLAGAYLLTERVGEAITMFEQLLVDRERVLGTDHPHTLTTRGDLAGAYLSTERREEAIAMFEDALADCERVLGPYYPLTVRVRDNLATAQRHVVTHVSDA